MTTRCSSKSACNSPGPGRFLRSRLYAAVLLALAANVQALPQGGEVAAGDVSIAVSGETMDIQQNSQRAILNFQSFDINDQQTVNFHQPGAEAVALSRVLGGNLSEIHGALNANGQVYLINPSGVLFGNGAQVNVGSLLVSTLDISDQDFLTGRDSFSGGDTGTVENNGSIRADSRVVLLAPEVINRGDISVPGGDITLRAGRQALLHTPGSEIPILLDDSEFIGQVINEGNLQAGTVALVLDGASQADMLDAAVNNSGLVRAVRASGEGGEIQLLSGGGLINSGGLDASAQVGDGGVVTLDAAVINQSGQIDATGAAGGDGGHAFLRATDAIVMHSGSHITADADLSGDGGEVVVIAEGATWFTEDATISARGGQDAGDGGFVEVSGHEFVSVAGAVDVGAENGEGGLWFIDPTDITITTNLDSNGTFTGSNPATWTPSGTPTSALVNVTTLRNTLSNDGNVLISTASGGAGQGNILFDATLDYNGLSGNRTLTLQANGSIIFNIGRHILDSNFGTVEGLNFNATAGNGFVLPDGSSIFAGTGKINITATTGDVTFTGLGSIADAADAIRVTANAGSLIDGGGSTWDLAATGGANSGVILSASSGIEAISIGPNTASVNGTYVDALANTGDISLFGDEVLQVSRLSAGGSASISSPGAIVFSDTSVLGGNNLQVLSTDYIAVPQSGISLPGILRLEAPDIVDENSGRTLSLGANRLDIITSATGGNLQINSATNLLGITNTSPNTITVSDVDALTLDTMEPQTGAISISSGAGTDLTIGTDIDLAGMAGALTLGAGRNLLLNASILDTDGPSVSLIAPNSVIFAAASEVNAGTGSVNITATSGDVALGRLTGGSMTVTAGGAITDANGAALNLSGTSASLTAGTAISTLADSLEGTLGSLNLTASGGGAFFSNSQALTLSSLNVSGNLNVSLPTTGNLTLSQTNPTLGGSATFLVAAGQLVVPNAGWSTSGNLTVNAQGIVDSDATVILAATGADLTLGGTAGVLNVDFNTLVLDVVNGQAMQLTDSDDLTVTSAGSNGNLTLATGGGSALSLGDIRIADGVVFNFTAGGTLTQTGQLSSTSGANNATLNFTSGAAMNINGNLRDAASSAGAHNFNFSAGTDFVMGSNARVVALGGLISIEALAGDATITGLVTLSTAQNAIEVFALNGAILEANAAFKDIDVPDGGFVLHAMGDVGDLQVESNFLNVVSAAGNVTLHEEASTSVLRLETPGTASMYTGNQFSVDLAAPLAVNNLLVEAGGDFRIADTGFSVTGDLTVLANTVRDSNPDVTMSAANADITILNGGTQARTWNTSFNQLVLDITGTGALSLTDSDGLTLASVSTGGNASFTTTNANLVVSATPTVAGTFALNTVGTGDVVIPNTGLIHGGNLTVSADNLRDSDNTLTLGAAAANINLRGGATAQTWTTSFDDLALSIAGAGALSLTDTNDLTITSATTGGSASYNATGANLVLTSVPTAGGDLTLGTVGSGDVVIPNAGLTRSGNLTVLADNLVDSDNNITLGATAANITLRDGAAARTWTTGFTSLALDIDGTGALTLTDSDGLTLNSVSTGGNASFTTTNANLVVSATPTVAGTFALNTVGTGDVVIPNTGLIHAGNLAVSADNLRDSDNTLTLGAAAANINLRGGASAQTWNTSFASLVLAIAGAGDFTLMDADGLTLTSASTGGNASYSAADANFVLAATPAAGGNLSLGTSGSGDVVIPDAGLVHTGNLTVVADNLVDSNHNLSLGAANANITLRDGAQARTWNTSFANLVLNIAGAGAFSLTDSNSLTLTSANTGGSASFSATNGDLVLASMPAVSGDLTLATVGSGDLVIPAVGLVHSGNLTVTADDLSDGDSSFTLGATNASFNLRGGAAAQTWNTSFETLALSLAGSGAFSLTDANGLSLGAITTGGEAAFNVTGADLVVTAAPTVGGALTLATLGSGDLVVPATGLTHTGTLTLTADNLRDTDTSLTLGATAASITLRDGAVDQTWGTSFGSLALNIAGAGDLNLTDTNGLTLTSATSGGNASYRTTSSDLVLTAVPTAAGDLTLGTVGSGNVLIPDAGLVRSGNLTVLADNLVDSDHNLTLGADGASVTLRDGAAARSWNTSFNDLVLAITGGGAFSLTDTNGLTLSSVTTGGSASFSSTGADLVLAASPLVGGDLTLTTVGSGDLVIPATGLTHGGNLALGVDNLSDGDTSLILGATGATIDLRGGNAAQSWTTSFQTLVLAIAGSGNFSLTDTNGLTLTSASTGGNASYSATNGDLMLVAAPTAAGDLTLGTVGSGDLVIPDAGLMHTSNLTVLSDNLVDSDHNLSLGAASANITLRDGTAARTWLTSFDDLVLAITGTGAFSLTDADGLTLSSVTTGGSAAFTSTNADLVLQTSPTVAGVLSLNTSGSGDLVISDTGLSHGGALNVTADQIRDADNAITLAATNLTGSLRDQQTAISWSTSLNSLDLTLVGTGSLALADAGDLSVASLVSDGAVDLSSTGDLGVTSVAVAQDLSLTSGGDMSLSDVSVGGDLTLVTATDGTLSTAPAGLTLSGNLSVDAGRLNGLSLWSADQISLRLRDTIAPTQLDLDAASVSLTNDSTAGLNLQLADGARLETLSSGGDVQVDGAGGLILGADTYGVAGQLAFDLPGDLTLMASGLNFNGSLQVTAANLLATGGGPVTLAGLVADLALTGSQALDLSTRLSQLGVTYVAAGPFVLNSDRTLTLTRFDAPAVDQVSLTVNGVLNIPASGLGAGQRLTLDAVDLSDGDRTLSLDAPQVMVRLANAAADSTWNLTANELDVLLRGAAGLTVNDAAGLTLVDLNNDGQAVSVENGNFVLDLTSGDLDVTANLSAADLVDDNLRTGLIDLSVASGSIRTQNALTMTSTNTLDQDAEGPAENYGIRLRLLDTSATDRVIALNGGASLRAIGGDIRIDTRPTAATGGSRQFMQGTGSLIEAYNNPGDTITGTVLLNGQSVPPSAGQTVRAERTLAIVTDMAPPDLGNPLDQIDDLDDTAKVVDETEASGPRASAQFEQVFGTCDELDQKNRHRCRVDTALKAFLSHWLVGGEMPPKTESPR